MTEQNATNTTNNEAMEALEDAMILLGSAVAMLEKSVNLLSEFVVDRTTKEERNAHLESGEKKIELIFEAFERVMSRETPSEVGNA